MVRAARASIGPNLLPLCRAAHAPTIKSKQINPRGRVGGCVYVSRFDALDLNARPLSDWVFCRV